MELMEDPFFKNNGRPVPQTVQKLGAGFGNLSGQAFSETQNSLGPQGEVLRFNDEHDPKTGQFTSGQGGHAGGGVSSVEELSRPGKNYIVTKTGRITYHGKSFAPEETPIGGAHVTVKPNGDFQVNEGVLTEAMKTALKSAVNARSFDLEPERDKDGKYSMGTVAKFEHEDGRIAYVTKYNGKFHVNVLKNGTPHLPGAIYADQEEAVSKAEELLKRNELVYYEYRDGSKEWF